MTIKSIYNNKKPNWARERFNSMWMFIGILSFLASFFFLLVGIVTAVKKTGTAKKNFKISGLLFAVLIAAMAADSANGDKPQTAAPVESTSASKDVIVASNTPVSSDAQNAEEEAKKKAEEAEASKKAEEERKAKEEADAKAKAEAEAKKIPGTIGMTPTQFMNAFNKASNVFDSKLKIKNIKVESGAVQNSFQQMFTDNLGIIGSVNKQDNSVRDVMIIGSGDGSPNSGLDIIVAMGVLITATNPELPANERGNVLEELGLMDEDADILNIDKKTIRNGIRYHIVGSEQLGIMFSAGDADDN